MIFYAKLNGCDGEFPDKRRCREHPVGERVCGLFGLSPRSLLSETAVGKHGCARYSIPKCPQGNSGGTAESFVFALS